MRADSRDRSSEPRGNRTKSVRGLCAALAGLCLGACVAEGSREGKRVEIVYETHEYELCAGTATHLDGYIERVFGFLGAAPGDFLVPVDVVATVTCGEREDATGCYDPNDERVIVSLAEYFRFRPTAVLRTRSSTGSGARASPSSRRGSRNRCRARRR